MATVTPGYTFTSNEVVTPAKLNSAASPTVAIANDEITTAKILNGNVTNAKLANDIDAGKLTTGTLPIARIADDSVTPAKLAQPLTFETAKSATGTSVEFTGIPAWAKRVTILFAGLIKNGTSSLQIQIGTSSAYLTTGYLGSMFSITNATPGTSMFATGLGFKGMDASGDILHGIASFTNLTGNTWIGDSKATLSNSATAMFSTTSVTLNGSLQRIRITSVNNDNFTAGTINICYEG